MLNFFYEVNEFTIYIFSMPLWGSMTGKSCKPLKDSFLSNLVLTLRLRLPSIFSLLFFVMRCHTTSERRSSRRTIHPPGFPKQAVPGTQTPPKHPAQFPHHRMIQPLGFFTPLSNTRQRETKEQHLWLNLRDQKAVSAGYVSSIACSSSFSDLLFPSSCLS